MFAAADHNIKMFSKIATFLQNLFIKKLICDLISQPIFKLIQQVFIKKEQLTKLVFIKKEDEKDIFKHPRRTNYLYTRPAH